MIILVILFCAVVLSLIGFMLYIMYLVLKATAQRENRWRKMAGD